MTASLAPALGALVQSLERDLSRLLTEDQARELTSVFNCAVREISAGRFDNAASKRTVVRICEIVGHRRHLVRMFAQLPWPHRVAPDPESPVNRTFLQLLKFFGADLRVLTTGEKERFVRILKEMVAEEAAERFDLAASRRYFARIAQVIGQHAPLVEKLLRCWPSRWFSPPVSASSNVHFAETLGRDLERTLPRDARRHLASLFSEVEDVLASGRLNHASSRRYIARFSEILKDYPDFLTRLLQLPWPHRDASVGRSSTSPTDLFFVRRAD